MRFNRHSEVEGRHATLSASTNSWLSYTPERLMEVVANKQAAREGTLRHELAQRLIDLGVKLPNTSQTLNRYVNDCIGYGMQTEKVLFYSYHAFGTADAIDFVELSKTLRIFDLKNGLKTASEAQLLVYAAYFCLEYKVRPMSINFDLRIYQNDDVIIIEVDPEEIAHIMDRIIMFDKMITESEG